MLGIHFPQPMPHAVQLDRALHPFVSGPLPKGSQPNIRSHHRKSDWSVALGSNLGHQTSPGQVNQLTPPEEMHDWRPTQNGSYNGPYSGQGEGHYGVGHNRKGVDHMTGEHTRSKVRSYQASSFDLAAYSQPASPLCQPSSMNVPDSSSRRKPSSNAIAPTLQIPRSINTPQSSMPQLAAEVTCLFWFENSSTIQHALEPRSPYTPVSPLSPDGIPTSGFRKWVTTILTTTQVTQNVILLALLFIYRLKKVNPTVKGKLGSEYRLLTVGLMLGNKFLDDNTYTNKTWAEVSGISVQEIHIMEVEFLSNMRYSLFTSEAQWKEWHVVLGQFGTYLDKASRPLLDVPPPTPTLFVPPSLPSPPNSNHASPPFLSNHSPAQSGQSITPVLHPQANVVAVSPIGSLPGLGKKRTYEDQAQEPSAKRTLRSSTQRIPSINSGHIPPTYAKTMPRLPLPNLSIPASQAFTQPPQLPPPNSRAMSFVYPTSAQWSQPPLTITSSAVIQPLMHPQLASSTGDQSRQLSPYPVSAAVSPINAGHQTPQSNLSPSFFLSQRQSPYRPVRNVTTLLAPPPSGSHHHYQQRDIGFDQMQYQSLGRPHTERRVGPLPYMHRDAWPETNQFNQWPVLPQPNFDRG